jgi:hypothetical protein
MTVLGDMAVLSFWPNYYNFWGYKSYFWSKKHGGGSTGGGSTVGFHH